MVVAVVPVRMMQMAVHQVIHMVPVRHCLVPASLTVHVPRFVPRTCVGRRTDIWIGLAHFQGALIHMAVMRVVQVTIMQIVDVILVNDCRMSTAGAVHVRMVFMRLVFAHDDYSFIPV